MFNKIKLYSFGDYIFKRVEYDTSVDISVNTQLNSSPLLDGSIRSNSFSRDTKEDYIMDVDFLVDDTDDLLYLKSLFFGEPQKIFFVSEDTAGNIKFYFNYGSCLSLVESNSSDEPRGQNEQILTASFRLMSPFYFLADDDNLITYDLETLKSLNPLVYNDGSTFNSGLVYNQTEIQARNYISSLSTETKKSLFGFENCKPKNFLDYKDNFFKKESSSYYFNYLKRTTDLTDYSFVADPKNVWLSLAGNITVNLNQSLSYTNNIDCSELVCTGATPTIRQDNIIIPTGAYDVTYSILIKSGTVGNATHFILESDNSIDGVQSSPLTAITSGQLITTNFINSGLYRHTFTFSKSASALNNDFILKLKTSGGTDPTVNSNVFVKDPSVYIEDIQGVNPTYQPIVNQPVLNFNSQNSFTYTLEASDTTSPLLYTLPINLNTGFTSKSVIIEFETLSQNESISIRNVTNNTGVKITWLNPIDSGDPTFLYLPDRVLSNIQGIINPFTGKYKIESLGSGMLNFRALRSCENAPINNLNNLTNQIKSDLIQIEKKAVGSKTIIIKTLPTEH